MKSYSISSRSWQIRQANNGTAAERRAKRPDSDAQRFALSASCQLPVTGRRYADPRADPQIRKSPTANRSDALKEALPKRPTVTLLWTADVVSRYRSPRLLIWFRFTVYLGQDTFNQLGKASII